MDDNEDDTIDDNDNDDWGPDYVAKEHKPWIEKVEMHCTSMMMTLPETRGFNAKHGVGIIAFGR